MFVNIHGQNTILAYRLIFDWLTRRLSHATQEDGIVQSPRVSEQNGDGVTLDVVCEGTPYEMGLAQGKALRDKIRTAMPVLLELQAFRLQKPGWMPLRVYRWLAERKAERYFEQALRWDAEWIKQQLAGIAEGAGVPRRGLELLNVMEAVLSDLRHSTFLPAAAACSAVAVTRSASKSGEPIVAHNFDYLRPVQPLYTVRESRPDGKLRSLEFTVAPLCGAVDGINEAGLCITNNYAYVTDAGRPAPTISMLVSDTLAHCTTVDEAVDHIDRMARTGGGILMLADAEDRIASLELSSTRSAVRLPFQDTDRLAHTNRFQCAKMADVELDPQAVHSKLAPLALRGLRVHESADERDRRFRRRIEERSRLTVEDVGKLMADHGPDGNPSLGTICMHSDYWSTTACIQLIPRSRRMRVAYTSACRARFSEFQL